MVGDSEIHIAHVGDSRAYLFRADELSQLTEDHTLVGRMVKEGRLQPEEAERHPQRSIITRALGVDDHVDVDLMTIPIEDGDQVLICSDGLSSMLDADAIRRELAEHDDPQAAVDSLIDRANEAGGEDNITVLLLMFDDGAGATAASADNASLTREVATSDVARRQETVQPGARREDTTGVFNSSQVVRRARASRRSRPVLATLILVALVTGAAMAAFKYLIVDNSYYVAPNDGGRLAIYRGLADPVLGMTFQEEVETSGVSVDELPDFLIEDVNDAIEADSLEDAQTTLANLEQRAEDEEFQENRNRTGGGKG